MLPNLARCLAKFGKPQNLNLSVVHPDQRVLRRRLGAGAEPGERVEEVAELPDSDGEDRPLLGPGLLR